MSQNDQVIAIMIKYNRDLELLKENKKDLSLKQSAYEIIKTLSHRRRYDAAAVILFLNNFKNFQIIID